jgi:hypothetical protein
LSADLQGGVQIAWEAAERDYHYRWWMPDRWVATLRCAWVCVAWDEALPGHKRDLMLRQGSRVTRSYHVQNSAEKSAQRQARLEANAKAS